MPDSFRRGQNAMKESSASSRSAEKIGLQIRFYQPNKLVNEFLVSKETVVLCRWERSKQKFGFIKRVDKG